MGEHRASVTDPKGGGERWEIYVCPDCGEHPEFNVSNICPGNHSQSIEGLGLPYMHKVEVVPASQVEALEAELAESKIAERGARNGAFCAGARAEALEGALSDCRQEREEQREYWKDRADRAEAALRELVEAENALAIHSCDSPARGCRIEWRVDEARYQARSILETVSPDPSPPEREKWRCPNCKEEYDAPIDPGDVWCPGDCGVKLALPEGEDG